MHWALQTGFLSEEGWSALIDTLQRFGIPHSIHDVVPKVGDLVPPLSLPHRNVICVGSYSMRHVAAKNGWTPGVFDLFEQDFVQQREHWGEHMLNARSSVAMLKNATFPTGRMFVRPTTDSKYFSGRVFTASEFEAWKRAVCDAHDQAKPGPRPDTLVQLSPPVSIFAEYRFWIVKGEIITQSVYKRGDQVFYSGEVDPRLAIFVQQRIEEWEPHDAFVIDVCDTEAGIKIVEINTLNSSGFYAAKRTKTGCSA